MSIIVTADTSLQMLTDEFSRIRKDWDLLENLKNSSLWQSNKALSLTADIQDAIDNVEAYMLKRGLLTEEFYTKSLQFKQKMTPLSDRYLIEYLADKKSLPYSGFDIFLHWSFVMKTFSAPLLLLSFIDHTKDFKESGLSSVPFQEVQKVFSSMTKALTSEVTSESKEGAMVNFSRAYEELLHLFLKIADNLYAMRGLMYVDANEKVNKLNLCGVIRVLQAVNSPAKN